MLLTMMRAKLHRATVTECDLHYEGSIAIDMDLLDVSGLLLNEEVQIWNINNGARIATYIIPGERGSGTVSVNGAAARYFQRGDKIIITAFAQMTPEEAANHNPTVVLIGEDNKIDSVKE